MKTFTATVVLALVLGLMLTGTVFAQGGKDQGSEFATAISKGSSGNFKSLEVVKCDAKKNICVIKTAQKGDQPILMTYAQYNGRFNAAKQLKAGDKITGQWTEVEGKYYITFLTKD
jgi:hypothetical protein